MDEGTYRGIWTKDEDEALIELTDRHG